MNIKSLLVFLILISIGNLKAQEGKQNQIDSTSSNVLFYGGFTHEHLDFFKKAFSFQGIETGVTISHKYLLGVYGSSFISNLEIEQAQESNYYFISQAGMIIGFGQNDTKFISLGMLLKAGYVSIISDNYNFALFQDKNPKVRVSGMIVTPQVYAAINVAKWMKIRTSVGYNFYQIKEQPAVSKSNLQNLSLTFGFLFGKFN